MKKILALILVFVMLVPCTSVFANEQAPISEVYVNSDFEEAYGVFDALGFLSDDIKSIEPNVAITRAQFAHLVACVTGVSGSAIHDGSYGFIDVQPDHIYATDIYNLKKMGVISGANDVQFLPDDKITYNEVSKILVSVMGYGVKAEMSYGGYPYGYVRVMDNLDVTPSGFTGGNSVTMQDAITMCFNATLVDVVEMTGIKNNEPIYTSVPGENILSVNHDVYYVEGIFSDNGFTALSGASSTSTDRVKIANVVINKGNTAFENELGKVVRAYYHDNNGIRTLKYVCATSDNEVVVINAKDITTKGDSSAFKLYYYDENDKEKVVNIDKLGDFIYNGKAYVDFTKEDLHITKGTITLINNDSDKEFDVVSVTVPQSFKVTNVDTNQEKIYGKYGDVVKYEDCDSVKVINKKGFKIALSEIKAGNVISVVKSKDGKIITIYVTDESVSGVVEATYDEDGKTYYKMGDKVYTYAPEYKLAVDANKNPKCKNIQIGDTYTFFVDVNGDICDVEIGNTTSLKYAYLMDAAPDVENMKTVVKFRLFMQDGTILETQAAKKVSVNGDVKDGNKLLDDTKSDFYRGKTYVKPQLIQVKVNSKNEITDINLYKEANSYGYNANEFSRDKKLNDVKYRGGNVMSLGGVYQITEGAVIFCVPSYDDFEDEALQIWTHSRLTSGAKYDFEIYDADSSLTTDIFLVVNDEPGSVFDTSLFTVDKVSRGLNQDGDAVKMISGVTYGTYTTYTEKEKGDIPDTVKAGDVLRVSKDGTQVTKVEVVANAGTSFVPSIKYYDGSTNMYEHDFIVHSGYLYSKSDRAVSVLTPEENVAQYGKIVSHAVNANAKVTVWDSAKKEAKAGTMADVMTNDIPDGNGNISVSENSTKVIVYRRQDYVREIVVIK